MIRSFGNPLLKKRHIYAEAIQSHSAIPRRDSVFTLRVGIAPEWKLSHQSLHGVDISGQVVTIFSIVKRDAGIPAMLLGYLADRARLTGNATALGHMIKIILVNASASITSHRRIVQTVKKFSVNRLLSDGLPIHPVAVGQRQKIEGHDAVTVDVRRFFEQVYQLTHARGEAHAWRSCEASQPHKLVTKLE